MLQLLSLRSRSGASSFSCQSPEDPRCAKLDQKLIGFKPLPAECCLGFDDGRELVLGRVCFKQSLLAWAIGITV